ncbi:MAG: SDR family NAD(P)-dependent oxidoreductase [Nakamurella sp.]
MPEHNAELQGQTALVTGAAGDIGAAIATELARRGAHVTCADLRDPAATVGGLPGSAHRGIIFDAADPAAVQHTLEHLPPFNIGICCTGVVDAAPFLDITTEQWHHHLEANLTSYFLVGQQLARGMVTAGTGGAITMIGSWVGAVPWPHITAYSVSKAGVDMLAKSMALELAKHRIRVNVVAPGIVDAGMARVQRLTEPDYAARITNIIPLEQLQSPEQVAHVAAFISSPAADYITGTTLLADGGASLFQFPS